MRAGIVAAACACLCIIGSAGAASAQESALTGKPLLEVLAQLQKDGLKLVFSSALVTSEMRVVHEPRSREPRRMLDELLRPHGLAVRQSSKGVLTIVRSRPRQASTDEGADAPGTIRGRIVDSRTAMPLADGLVKVESTGQEIPSDADGRFELPGVPAGPQKLLVSLIGYGLVRVDVVVPAGGVTERVVPLAEGAGTYREQITVVASSFRDAEIGVAGQSSLGSRDLAALRGVMADDPLRAVQALPGVMTGDDFRAEFAVRGHGTQHLALSLDGIDSRFLFHTVRGVEDTGSLALVNSDILESVSVVAGARPQRMQAALGAGVNLETRDGASDRLHVRGLLSATAASTVWEGPAGRRATFLVAARQSYLDWVLRKVDPDVGGTFGFTDGQAKLTWTPNPRHTLRALFLGGRSILHEHDDPLGLNTLDTGANNSKAASLQWRFGLSDTVQLSQQIYAVGAAYRNFTPLAAIREEGTDLDVTWRGAIDWSHARGRVEAGGQAQHAEAERVDRTFTSTGSVTTLSSAGRGRNGAAWIHTNWTLAPGVVVSPGVRVDRFGLVRATTASPWLLAEWQMTPGTRWRAGAAVHHQSPLVEQTYFTAQRSSLEPERAESWDVGLERALSAAWRATVSVYGRREQDRLRLIDGEPRVESGAVVFPTQPHWENALTGTAHGAGVSIERRSVNGLSGWISYGYGRAELTDAQRQERFASDFDQRHTFNAYGIFRWSGRTALSARWRVGSNFPIPGYFDRVNGIDTLSSQRNRLRLPAYSRLDIRADRSFTRRASRFTLFVEVLNVLNRSNTGPGDPDISNRTTRVSGLVEELFPVLPTAGLLVEF